MCNVFLPQAFIQIPVPLFLSGWNFSSVYFCSLATLTLLYVTEFWCPASPTELFSVEMEMLGNDLHIPFSGKIKIFPLVTLWTDNEIFCPINCSFHCYFSKEVVKLYMCKNRKAKCMPLFFLPALDTLSWEMCKMHINCCAVCNMTWSYSSWGKYTRELFFHWSDKQTSLRTDGVTKAAFLSQSPKLENFSWGI